MPATLPRSPKPATTARLSGYNPVMGATSRVMGWGGMVLFATNMLKQFGFSGSPVAEGEKPKGFRQTAGHYLSALPRAMSKPTGEVLPEKVIDGAATGIGTVQKFFGDLIGAPARAERRAGKINQQLGDIGSANLANPIRNSLEMARDALQVQDGKAYHSAMETAQLALQNEMMDVPSLFKDFKGNRAAKKHNSALQKEFNKASSPLTDSMEANHKAAFWADPITATKDRLQNQSLMDTAYDGIRAVSVGVSVYDQSRDTLHGFRSIQQLHADVKGGEAKDVGLLTLWRSYFSSTTPPLLKKAIGAYTKNTVFGWGFLTAGTWLQQVAYRKIGKMTGGNRGQQMLGSVAVMQGFAHAEKFLTTPDNMLKLYESMRNMQHAGVKLTAARPADLPSEYATPPNYIDLIVTSIPSLETNNGYYNKEATTVARHFEATQAPVEEVMKILAQGAPAINALAAKIMEEKAVAQKQVEAAAAAAPSDQAQAPAPSAALPPQRKERAILGEHTKKVVASGSLQHQHG